MDKMGVMYYSRYFEVFEEARTELLRELGVTYSEMEDRGFFLPVVEAHCRYRKPALYDDILEIYCDVSEFTGVKMAIDYNVIRSDVRIAMGITVHAVMDSSGKLTRLPSDIAGLIKEYLLRGGNEQ